MTLGLHDDNRRYRRRSIGRIFKLVLLLVLLGATGLFGYQLGIERSKTIDQKLEERLEALAREHEAQTSRLGQVEAAHRSEKARADALEKRYQEDVPTGALKELTDQVDQRLSDGVEAARLAFVIGAVSNKRDCQPAATKRFYVRTPAYRGGNLSTGFARNAITLSAEGEPVRDSQGRPEYWFDPAEPVTVTFTRIDGEVTQATATLPMQQSLVFKDSEYRFTIAQDDRRGFVTVTGDVCTFP